MFAKNIVAQIYMTDIKVNGTLTLEANIIDNITPDFRFNGVTFNITNMDNGVLSTDNSTSETLGVDSTYTGTYEDVVQFASISIIGSADNPVTVYVDFSTDGISAIISLQISDGSTDIGVHNYIPVSRYYRVRVIDGGSGAAIVIQTILNKNSKIAIPTVPITGVIDEFSDTIVTRSVLAGQTIGGGYQNVQVRNNKLVTNTPLCAFGDMSTITPHPVIQQSFLYNINTDQINTDTSTGTVTQSQSMAVLQTTASSSAHAQLSTRKYIKYKIGQGVRTRFTSIFTTGVANSTQKIGVFTDDNGMGFGYDGASFGCFLLNAGTYTWVPQTTWNEDRMDGSSGEFNPSGALLDPTKGNVYSIKFQWLGFGAMAFYIEEPSESIFILVHVISYSNANLVPSTRNPSFPLAARVENTTNTSNITLKTASMSADVEGKISYLGPQHAIDSTKDSVPTTLTNILTIRNKTTFASITNFVPITISKYSLGVTGSKTAIFRLVRNATLGGTPSYTDISTNTSVVDYDTAGTTITGGVYLDGSAIAKEGSLEFAPKLGTMDLYPGETLTIAASSTVTTTDVTGFITWIEDI